MRKRFVLKREKNLVRKKNKEKLKGLMEPRTVDTHTETDIARSRRFLLRPFFFQTGVSGRSFVDAVSGFLFSSLGGERITSSLPHHSPVIRGFFFPYAAIQ